MKLSIILFYLIFYLSISIEVTNCTNLLLVKKKGKTNGKMSLFEFNKKLFQKQLKTFFYKHVAENFKFVGVDSKKLKENNSVENKEKSNQYYNDDVLTQGWVKFLEISENSRDPPSSFIKNNMYFLQMSENVGINTVARDNVGYVNIPNEEYFFGQLTESRLKILTSRNDRYKRLEKVLKISDLMPQESYTPCKGGIEDVGNFEEGYCFMVKFTNYSKLFIWELCADSVYEKDKWMRRLEDLSRNKNINTNDSSSNVNNSLGVTALHVVGPPVSVNHVVAVGPHPSQMFAVGPSPAPVIAVQSPVGYEGFQVSGTWSECSKTCGKGIQTRIWICTDEKICTGKRLEERLCNIQACKEEIETGLSNLKKATEGHWEFLGTWSECTVPCGGGIQTITRKCTSGACIGMQTIVTQSCNVFECLKNSNSMENIRLSIPECRTLDGNLFMIINNQMVLSHIVVNTNNIMIYPPDHPNFPISIPLVKVTEVRNSYSHPNCFKVLDSIGQAVYLCPPHDPVQNASKNYF